MFAPYAFPPPPCPWCGAYDEVEIRLEPIEWYCNACHSKWKVECELS